MKPMKLMIGLAVIVFHIACIMSYNPPPPVIAKKRIVARTFVEQRPAPVRTVSVKKKVAAKTRSPTAAPKKSAPIPAKKVAKIAPKEDNHKKTTTLDVPQAIGSLAVDVPEADEEPSMLIGFLRRSLLLPEEGTVKIEIAIAASGKVERTLVLFAESDENRRYLIEQMEKMTLPVRGKKQTLTITFKNETNSQ